MLKSQQLIVSQSLFDCSKLRVIKNSIEGMPFICSHKTVLLFDTAMDGRRTTSTRDTENY